MSDFLFLQSTYPNAVSCASMGSNGDHYAFYAFDSCILFPSNPYSLGSQYLAYSYASCNQATGQTSTNFYTSTTCNGIVTNVMQSFVSCPTYNDDLFETGNLALQCISSSSDDDNDNSISTGGVVGVAIGCFFGGVLVVALIFFFACNSNRTPLSKQGMEMPNVSV